VYYLLSSALLFCEMARGPVAAEGEASVMYVVRSRGLVAYVLMALAAPLTAPVVSVPEPSVSMVPGAGATPSVTLNPSTGPRGTSVDALAMWPVLVALLGLAAIAALLTYQGIRARRDRRWLRRHTRLQPWPAQPRYGVREPPNRSSAATTIVRLEPRLSRTAEHVEEVSSR
jgi:hypothetical protein